MHIFATLNMCLSEMSNGPNTSLTANMYVSLVSAGSMATEMNTSARKYPS